MAFEPVDKEKGNYWRKILCFLMFSGVESGDMLQL